MSRTFRIAILPMHEPGFVPTSALSQAVDNMFIANAAGEAVFQYWNEVSGGYVDIRPTRLPWKAVPRAFAASDITSAGAAGMKISRATQLALYKQVVGSLAGMQHGGHGSYDALVYLLFPANDNSITDANGAPITFQFEGGNHPDPGDLPTAILPVGTAEHTHSFFTHEVGHLLGLRDGQGIFRWGGSEWLGGYGDPLEIMSAQSWFGGDPTYQGQPVSGWPATSSGILATSSMGPAPSLAAMHVWDPGYLPPYAIHDIHVIDNSTPSFRLDSAYGNGTRRLAIVRAGVPGQPEAAGGLGRMYLEFRDRRGWDQGIDKPGATRARTSLVAHVVQTGEGGTPQAFYKGQIVIPFAIDMDLDVPGSPYNVRVSQFGDGFVTVKVARTGTRGFKVDADVEQSSVQVNPHAIEVRVTPCGDRLRWGRWNTRTEGVFTPTAWGYGGPGTDVFAPIAPPPGGNSPPLVPSALTLNWFVGGQPVPQTASGSLAGCVAPEGTFDISYNLDPQTQRLTLLSKYGDRFTMPVRAQLIDTVLGLTVDHTEAFPAEGGYTGYPPADIAKLIRCGARMASELRIDPDAFRIPDGEGPRPNWHDHFVTVIDQLRITRPESRGMIDRLAEVGELARELRLPG